jgi:ABC-type lipoprotein release transport system permease subunit
VLVWRLAWRNLWRHRGRSMVVGGILFMGALLLTFGNGVVSGMERGLQRQVVESFTGDVVVASSKQQDDNVFLSMMGKEVEPLYRMSELEAAVDSLPWVKATLPVGKNMAMALHESEGNPGYLFLLGVDFAKWKAFFPNAFEVKAGKMPGPGEPGLLLPTGANDQLYQTMGQIFLPQGVHDTNLLPEDARRLSVTNILHEIVLMGFSNSMSTSDLRLDVLGVGRFRALNTIWGHFALTDIESYRTVQGYLRQDEQAVTLTDDQRNMMASDNLDAMLAEGSAQDVPVAASSKPDTTDSVIDKGSDPAWNLMLVRLKGETAEQGAARLDTLFQQRHLPARALPWHKAVGVIGSLAMLIRGALLGFVGLLFVVAGIVIANTLAMSALERTTEIGMMRAVGATRTFIARMMMSETAMLAAVFGGMGVVVGALLVAVVPHLGITTGNDLLQMVYGGEVFQPLLRPQDLVACFLELGLVVALASLYPMKLAASITPLDAIARE